jgi:hypothetical protein
LEFTQIALRCELLLFHNLVLSCGAPPLEGCLSRLLCGVDLLLQLLDNCCLLSLCRCLLSLCLLCSLLNLLLIHSLLTR